jgi:hypothetical protein
MFSRFVIAGLLLAGLSACATVTRGTTSQVTFLSEPSGAQVRTSLGQVCASPCTLQFNRKDEFAVTFSLPGYLDQTVQVRTQVSGGGAAGAAGNLLVGGVVGLAADAATGATLEHVPNPVSVVLQRSGPVVGGLPPRR